MLIHVYGYKGAGKTTLLKTLKVNGIIGVDSDDIDSDAYFEARKSNLTGDAFKALYNKWIGKIWKDFIEKHKGKDIVVVGLMRPEKLFQRAGLQTPPFLKLAIDIPTKDLNKVYLEYMGRELMKRKIHTADNIKQLEKVKPSDKRGVHFIWEDIVTENNEAGIVSSEEYIESVMEFRKYAIDQGYRLLSRSDALNIIKKKLIG